MRVRSTIAIAVISFLGSIRGAEKPRSTPTAGGRDWPAYGGVSAGNRYSTLKQINRSNVSRLEIAWKYDTGDGPGEVRQMRCEELVCV